MWVETISLQPTQADKNGRSYPLGPVLYRLIACDAPLEPAVALALSSVDEVVFTRGASSGSSSVPSLTDLRLTLPVHDPRVSSIHARLLREGERFVLEDAGSKNGTVVNGSAQTRVVICDGDLIELGRTFFLFRAQARVVALPEGLQPDVLRTFSSQLQGQYAALREIADSKVPVLIRGPSGTGKELIARAVHEFSARRGEFVAINCGALSDSLLLAELFGSTKGAFSGSTRDRPGMVRAADRGTLFLDEIGDMPLSAQPALLRVLQEQQVTPIGSTRSQQVDVRAVAATHRDLETMVACGLFRADLLARLNGFTLTAPTLADRKEDLGLLIGTLLRKHGANLTFSREAMRALLHYSWPLNVRELEQCLTSGIARRVPQLDLEHLPRQIVEGRPLVARRLDLPASTPLASESRRGALVELLRRHKGSIAAVARELGKDRVQIRRWMRAYGLATADFKA